MSRIVGENERDPEDGGAALTWKPLRQLLTGEEPPMVFRAIAAALDIVGEAGVRNDAHLEKLYRDVKILDIGEGTQQVQRLVVARHLLDLPREV